MGMNMILWTSGHISLLITKLGNKIHKMCNIYGLTIWTSTSDYFTLIPLILVWLDAFFVFVIYVYILDLVDFNDEWILYIWIFY